MQRNNSNLTRLIEWKRRAVRGDVVKEKEISTVEWRVQVTLTTVTIYIVTNYIRVSYAYWTVHHLDI